LKKVGESHWDGGRCRFSASPSDYRVEQHSNEPM
jgi:hypothetical protein